MSIVTFGTGSVNTESSRANTQPRAQLIANTLGNTYRPHSKMHELRGLLSRHMAYLFTKMHQGTNTNPNPSCFMATM